MFSEIPGVSSFDALALHSTLILLVKKTGGRGQETAGEDPFVCAEYAMNFVQGLQGFGKKKGQKSASKYLKASASCKHFIGYSMETNRHRYDAQISDFDLNDTYFVPFKYCIHSGASSVMCSYNRINGIPSCADKQLLTGLIRKKWHFDGYIVSDCYALQHLSRRNAYFENDYQTLNGSFDAGVDLDCGNTAFLNFYGAIHNGYYSLNKLKYENVYRSVMVLMRLGIFDDPLMSGYSHLDAQHVDSAYHRNLSLSATEQSIVLLKNKHNALPLRINGNFSFNLFVSGPIANDTQSIKGDYHGNAPFMIDILSGIKSYLAAEEYEHVNVHFDKGVNVLEDANVSVEMNENVKEYVDKSDVILLAMGLNEEVELERLDRRSLYLPLVQQKYISMIVEYASKRKKKERRPKIILLLSSGGCLDVSEWDESDFVDAILWLGYGGMWTGKAMANVLFGDVSPFAKLTQTWYLNAFLNEVDIGDMNMRPNKSKGTNGRGYRYYNGENVLYPFGYGLSYSKFECSMNKEKNGMINVKITNIGDYDSGCIVLIYWRPKEHEYLQKRLIGFENVYLLKRDESMNVNIFIYPEFMQSSEYRKKGTYVLSGDC